MARALARHAIAFRGLVRKETGELLRSRKAFGILLAILLASATAFVASWIGTGRETSVEGAALLSRAMFAALVLVQLVAFAIVSPAVSAAAISTERENRTLDLLYTTGLTRGEIVAAKWCAAILFQLALVVCALPILSLSFLAGGVDLREYLGAATTLVVQIATLSMIGLWCSTRFRSATGALVAALAFSAALLRASPPHSGAWRAVRSAGLVWVDFSLGLAPAYLIGAGAFALLFAGFALRNLKRGEAVRPVVATKFIDDEATLLLRRSTWPYYMIDPLARPQDIADDENPVAAKEGRANPFARPVFLIRSLYAALLLSIVVAFASWRISDPFESLPRAATIVVFLCAVVVPAVGSTGLSSEREQGTLELLRATPMPPDRILRAKLAAPLRLTCAVAATLFVFPTLLHLAAARGSDQSHLPLEAACAAISLLGALAYQFLFCATGLLVSSFCRRNVAAILGTALAIGLFLLSPAILELAQNALYPATRVAIGRGGPLESFFHLAPQAMFGTLAELAGSGRAKDQATALLYGLRQSILVGLAGLGVLRLARTVFLRASAN